MANDTANFHKFKDALRHVLVNYSDEGVRKGQALRKIAEKLVKIAINGSEREALTAVSLLVDRLDGKAVQAITGIEGEPITIIKRVIVHQVLEGERDAKLIEVEDIKTIN